MPATGESGEISAEEAELLHLNMAQVKGRLIRKLMDKCDRLIAQVKYLQETENAKLASIALTFEGNPREKFCKPDSSPADAAIARILKDREMGTFVCDFKQKYDGLIDWQTFKLCEKQIKQEIDSDVIDLTQPSTESERNNILARKRDLSAVVCRTDANQIDARKRIKSDPDQLDATAGTKISSENQTFKIEFKGATISFGFGQK